MTAKPKPKHGVSLAPLSFGQAIDGLLRVKPTKKATKTVTKKRRKK
jgi:hypothetical protein